MQNEITLMRGHGKLSMEKYLLGWSMVYRELTLAEEYYMLVIFQWEDVNKDVKLHRRNRYCMFVSHSTNNNADLATTTGHQEKCVHTHCHMNVNR